MSRWPQTRADKFRSAPLPGRSFAAETRSQNGWMHGPASRRDDSRAGNAAPHCGHEWSGRDQKLEDGT